MFVLFSSHKDYAQCLMEALTLSFLVPLFLCSQSKSAFSYIASKVRSNSSDLFAEMTLWYLIFLL